MKKLVALMFASAIGFATFAQQAPTTHHKSAEKKDAKTEVKAEKKEIKAESKEVKVETKTQKKAEPKK